MSDRTGIEWTDATWNPVTGCTKVSTGCDHCYAESIGHRFDGTKAYPNGFDVTHRPERLDQPLRWKRPRRVFVNSMSDLFHDDVPDDYIAKVWAVMALAPQHTFQVLTKRHARMRSLLSDWDFQENIKERYADNRVGEWTFDWPLPNVWLGVSTEDQRWADIRIPALLDTPAAVRFISAEPLLGSIDLAPWVPHLSDSAVLAPLGAAAAPTRVPGWNYLDWVIVGGESGHGARPMHPAWARSLRDQCVTAGVPFHFKQWGEWGLFGDTAHYLEIDGTLYAPGDLTWPDGPRVGEALRSPHRRLHTVYRVGKKRAGRELDGRTWDQYPGGER